MKLIDDLLDRADAMRRRWPPDAFAVAVWKKFSDDRAGDLAAPIAYYAFRSDIPAAAGAGYLLDLVLRHAGLRALRQAERRLPADRISGSPLTYRARRSGRSGIDNRARFVIVGPQA